ncbi:SAM-dependent methyltransferase, partial [Mycobacterium tuberculosis]
QLLADVAAVRTDDFDLTPAAERDIDDSLDLVAIAVRP